MDNDELQQKCKGKKMSVSLRYTVVDLALMPKAWLTSALWGSSRQTELTKAELAHMVEDRLGTANPIISKEVAQRFKVNQAALMPLFR